MSVKLLPHRLIFIQAKKESIKEISLKKKSE